MKKIKFYTLSCIVLASMSLFFASCGDDNSSGQTSRVTVRMVDAPGDYDEVNVEVLDVLIKNSSDTGDQGWISIGDKTQVGEGKIYNLLSLTGGVNALLADNEVPSGNLGQIRLLLGDENTVVKGVTSYPLKTPSAQQSGLKLKINQTLEVGKTYEFLLDFDVERSVVIQAGGSGNYNLHPVIRVSTKENTGGISGKVVSPTATPVSAVASILVEGGTVSASTNTDGVFQLNGVPAGTYMLTLDPGTASTYSVKTISGVIVVNGAITDVGSQSLVLKP